MNTLARPRPLVVIILDGWGLRVAKDGNAIQAAETPSMDLFVRSFPAAGIVAAGLEVGLPAGQAGNSETGHRNIGAGRVEYQILASIDRAIGDKSFFSNKVLLSAVEHAKKNRSNLHLAGLISRGGVHSHMNHLFALLKILKQTGFTERVYIHMFADGRDAPPQSALTYISKVEEEISKIGVGQIASITGRFYAMDRNRNWERTEAAYNMLIGGERPAGAPSIKQAVEDSYAKKVFDEMILPTAVTYGGSPIAPINDNDAVLFFNFRPDRSRQLVSAFVEPSRVSFKARKLKNIHVVTLSEYDPSISAAAAFVEDIAEYPLAKTISEMGLRQLHIAETEKYAHITYYLNVGHEKAFAGEKRVLIRSSNVHSFAKRPKMEAEAITDRVIKEIERSAFDVYIVNFANPDMVGHTGDLEATVKACAYVDRCLSRLYQAVTQTDGALIITADHGNAEEMQYADVEKSVSKEHSVNPVPLFYVRDALRRTIPKSDGEVKDIMSSPIGVLADVTPTILDILQIPKPPTMTGVSLLDSLR
jgi:2,3-bisphosphoglycerate-independent phosphoglycerate mutase